MITAPAARVRRPRAAELRARLRAVWSSSKRRVALGLTRMALWFRVRARARRARRRRQVLAYLAQAQPQAQGERASAALLAVLTERIARAGASDASEGEIADAVVQAERIIAGYEAQRAELEALLVVARGRTRRWVHWVGVADAKGSPALAARARSYLAEREGDAAELQRGVEDCDAGCRRLRDAIEQLRALAGRGVK